MGRSRIHTHTVSSTPIAAVANATKRVPERERGGFHLHLGQVSGHRTWPAVTVKDFWLFGVVVCMESQIVIQCHSGSARRDFFKGELRLAWKGPLVQLPYQQGKRTEGTVCSH